MATASLRTYEPTSPESLFLAAQFARNFPDIVSGRRYREGRAAKAAGKPLTANPWAGQDGEEWRKGWFGAESRWATAEREAA